jgi:predicted permease
MRYAKIIGFTVAGVGATVIGTIASWQWGRFCLRLEHGDQAAALLDAAIPFLVMLGVVFFVFGCRLYPAHPKLPKDKQPVTWEDEYEREIVNIVAGEDDETLTK